MQVKEARSPQTSQSGSAFGGGRADAADARADAAAAEAAAAGGVGEVGDARRWSSDESPSEVMGGDGDVLPAVAVFFPPLFFDMVVVDEWIV